jgi:hypothetical protein
MIGNTQQYRAPTIQKKTVDGDIICNPSNMSSNSNSNTSKNNSSKCYISNSPAGDDKREDNTKKSGDISHTSSSATTNIDESPFSNTNAPFGATDIDRREDTSTTSHIICNPSNMSDVTNSNSTTYPLMTSPTVPRSNSVSQPPSPTAQDKYFSNAYQQSDLKRDTPSQPGLDTVHSSEEIHQFTTTMHLKRSTWRKQFTIFKSAGSENTGVRGRKVVTRRNQITVFTAEGNEGLRNFIEDVMKL